MQAYLQQMGGGAAAEGSQCRPHLFVPPCRGGGHGRFNSPPGGWQKYKMMLVARQERFDILAAERPQVIPVSRGPNQVMLGRNGEPGPPVRGAGAVPRATSHKIIVVARGPNKVTLGWSGEAQTNGLGMQAYFEYWWGQRRCQ